jgi:hypothetical protein
MFKKCLAIMAGWLLAISMAGAQQVVYLSSDAASASYVVNSYNAFRTAAGAANIVDARGVLTSTSPNTALLDGVEVVVVLTAYNAISTQWMSVLQSAMLSRPDLTFVMFIDGCCVNAANLDRVVATMNTGTGWGITTPTYYTTTIDSPLNTNSLYQGSFTGLPIMKGTHYRLMTNVPADNALYLANGTTTMPAIGTTTAAYGFFVPQQRFNSGGGACIFLTADASPFDGRSAQYQSIANSFWAAANDPTGACKQAAREPDLLVTLSGASAPPVGVTTTYTATVTNQGVSTAAASTVNITVPAGMTIVTSTLPSGCTASGQVVSCPVASLATGVSTTYAIQVVPTQTGSVTMSAAVGVVTDEVITANNTTTLPIVIGVNTTVVTTAQPMAVPTLSEWSLLLLGVLLPGLMMVRRRRHG